MTEELIEDAEVVEGVSLVVRAPSQEIVASNLFGVEDPVEVLTKAARVASALADVVKKQKLTKNISGKEHVLVEGWQLLGSMLGVFPVLELCEPIERRGTTGYRAVMTAQTKDGSIVGRAEALCLRDEPRWKNADEYAIASMAQTRATSKALKGPLGFVMKLAGFEPTPAEDMDFRDRVEVVHQDESEADKAKAVAELRKELKRLEGVEAWSEVEVIGAARSSFGRARISALSDMTLDELGQILAFAKTVVPS